MLYSNINLNTLLFLVIFIILCFIIDFIIELLDFKKFAKEKYDLNINLISFTIELILTKLKKTRI